VTSFKADFVEFCFSSLVTNARAKVESAQELVQTVLESAVHVSFQKSKVSTHSSCRNKNTCYLT